MEHEFFSKRQQRMQDENPDTFQDETIPENLRVQIVYIWAKVWGIVYENDAGEPDGSRLGMEAFRSIENTLCEGYGVFNLQEPEPYREFHISYLAVKDFFMNTEDTDKVIDVIEVSFQYIDQVIRDKFNDDGLDEIFGSRHRDIPPDSISPDEAINQLNQRFRQHKVGYQYESGQIMKVDSQFIHSETVKPTLMFLSNPIYKGANKEFLKAHEHYREGNYKDCINNCLNAFESCLKVICQKQGWTYGTKDTANRLISIIFDNELIPPLMQSHFSGLRSALESGVPTIRNNWTAHGQGIEEITVPEYIAAYILHLTASNILLLAKADEDKK